ncbi:MAG TPA: nucleotidyltransferase domain-containing protein [Vicinamibacterales bacterium]|nr:nucleotidyltransferase domain-containing protein [Vicinamibacterales bacterium]
MLQGTAYTGLVLDALRRTLSDDSRIAYALVFGSTARGTSHALSDVDVAIGTTADAPLGTLDIGELTSRLEAAAGRAVHLVVLNDAPPGLAYRVFKDGTPLLIRDTAAFKSRLARAILEYLDFRPVEELFTRGVLGASDGR